MHQSITIKWLKSHLLSSASEVEGRQWHAACFSGFVCSEQLNASRKASGKLRREWKAGVLSYIRWEIIFRPKFIDFGRTGKLQGREP